MSQLSLNFSTHSEVARATVCLLKNIPLAQWITYIGTTIEERHECVDSIIERSMKESDLNKARTIDKLVEKIPLEGAVIRREAGTLNEPIEDETAIKDIYKKIINIGIRRSKSEFEGLEEIRKIINPKLPLSDEMASEVQKMWRTQATYG